VKYGRDFRGHLEDLTGSETNSCKRTKLPNRETPRELRGFSNANVIIVLVVQK
jgi:hypothetical protein